MLPQTEGRVGVNFCNKYKSSITILKPFKCFIEKNLEILISLNMFTFHYLQVTKS